MNIIKSLRATLLNIYIYILISLYVPRNLSKRKRHYDIVLITFKLINVNIIIDRAHHDDVSLYRRYNLSGKQGKRRYAYI